MECHVGGFEYDKDLLESWGRDAVTTRLLECAQTGKMRKEAHVETFQERSEERVTCLPAGKRTERAIWAVISDATFLGGGRCQEALGRCGQQRASKGDRLSNWCTGCKAGAEDDTVQHRAFVPMVNLKLARNDSSARDHAEKRLRELCTHGSRLERLFK